MTTERYPIPPWHLGIMSIPSLLKETIPFALTIQLQISGPLTIAARRVEWNLYYTILPSPGHTGQQRVFVN